jgi:cytochrome c-type biogenesis protein CcmH/NrfG
VTRDHRAPAASRADASACSSALNEPSPIAGYAPGHAQGRNAAQLVTAANAAWTKRAQNGNAEAAMGMYLDAAVLDPNRTDALIGAMRAIAFRIEYEPGVEKGKLVGEAVELGQWCQRRTPADAECDYRLAIALGQQARERPSTGRDALRRMVELLHHAIAASPRLDNGGAQRVLALVLLRAPGWPVGPGDVDAALEQAQAAVRIAPRSAANQLVLGEALTATGRTGEALAAYRNAAKLAGAEDRGDPEVKSWLAQANDGIAKNGGS